MALGYLVEDGGGSSGTNGKYAHGTANKNGTNPVSVTCGFRPTWVIVADLTAGGNMYSYKDGDTVMRNCAYGATYYDRTLDNRFTFNDNGFTWSTPTDGYASYFRYWAFGDVEPLS